ncbi:MAG: GntR family transcriptional regulator [Lawsonibacter sp.]|nr:GntR family transcriptional regulator [Lawsonibacter sp.]
MPGKESLKSRAYHTIKQKIVTCEYAPRTLLNEELLREELHVSRTPIRDALSRLEQEGMITILPKKGIMISDLSIQDINMVFEVRQMYEPYALLHYGSQIPYETLMCFWELFSHPEQMVGWADQYEADDAFHSAIMNAMPNRYLHQSYEWIRTQNLRFRVMSGNASQDRLGETYREHKEILTACLKQDWPAAAEEMHRHLTASKNATFDLLLKRGTLKEPEEEGLS